VTYEVRADVLIVHFLGPSWYPLTHADLRTVDDE